MKKKTRDLKKHYRNVERELRSLDIELSEESWYRMWHTHLDWGGVSSVSNKHRKIHILYYLKILEKIDLQTKGSKRDFQTWIYLDGHDGTCDAIYYHTENPKGDFPYWVDNVEWNIEIPQILLEILEFSKFNIGVMRSVKENMNSYIIQKKGLGLKINKQQINL